MSNIELNPYIFFKGNCRAAFEFYKTVFDGELTMQTMGEVPSEAGMEIDESRKDEIMHAELSGGIIKLFGSDSQAASVEAAKVELSLNGSDEAKLREIFENLGEGGKIRMPLEKQFWGDTFGMVTDKFNVDWMVNISRES